ncbi:MAG: hypothetical protein R6U31_03955 [bacterium]
MNYIEFRHYFKDYAVIGMRDIYAVEPDFDNRRLYEWNKKGYIKKIINGFYIFSDRQVNEGLMFRIANRIYRHSYVSLETALSYYNLIPEQIFMITSVSTRKTKTFDTDIGRLGYKNIKNEIYLGYDIVLDESSSFLIASPEKALLDYFYLNAEIDDRYDIAGLRINHEVYNEIVDENKLMALADYIDNNRIKGCIETLVKENAHA